MHGITMAQFGAIVLGFVVVAVVISMGGEILEALRTEQTAQSYAYNITGEALEGAETFGDWLPTIAVVIAAAVVIGIIVTYFRFRG